MTGTSLDGVDVAIAEFTSNENNKHSLKLIAFNTYHLPGSVKELALKIIGNKGNLQDITLFHFLLPQVYAEAIQKLCSESGFPIDNIDAIGMHGQTVWHEPHPKSFDKFDVSGTFQLGSPSALANILNIQVVGDFRAADIALGGQGAPLVPIFDYEFLRNDNANIIALNIGGIANITYIKKSCAPSNVVAFDTGPGNSLIDAACRSYLKIEYDKDGENAQKGKLIPELFEKLMNHLYIKQSPPKSTGKELFNWDYVCQAMNEINYSDNYHLDIFNTLTQFTASSIALNIRKFASDHSKIIISGGGANNKYLLKLLNEQVPDSKIIKSDEIGIPADAKEAIAFAYLAYRTLGGLHGNLPSVTGAKREAVLGVLGIP
jgi:anhydro-N-acetylmuramic acid kinase